jgi:branched-chain amino acid transport system substrate-binding protein
VTGRLACDQFGDCSAVEFVVLQFDDPAAGLDGLRSNIVHRTTQK